MTINGEIRQHLVESLRSKNVVLEAYPGWGKTRMAASLVGEYKKVAVVVRTIEELRETVSMASTKLIALYGKEKLCPVITDGYKGIEFYNMCRRYRLLNLCRYKYEADQRIIRFMTFKFRLPDEIRGFSKDKQVCPYPSMMALMNRNRVVTTYGFVFAHPNLLGNSKFDLVVFDESHELISAVLEFVEVYNEQSISSLVESLKHDVSTRMLAYAVRQCWRRSRSFAEFVECLERQPDSHEAVDRIINLFRSKRSYVSGKVLAVAPSTLNLPGSGCLFLSAYTPPFILDLIPNAEVLRIEPPPELSIEAHIDDTLSSRYEERTQETYKAYAEKILDYYSASDANLVLFPSYEFMDNVKQYLPPEFIERVKSREAIRSIGEGDVVFDVAGGIATEGVNPSPALRRVIVVGLPYPPPSIELNTLAKVYGFDNTYTYLALLKVIQAIGRMRFRKGADAVLIDRRYKNVLKFLPPYLKPT